MMDSESLKWATGIFVATVTTLIAAFYRMGTKIAKVDEKVDSVKDDYVRRDDFNDHQKRIEKRFDKIDEKLDKLIARK